VPSLSRPDGVEIHWEERGEGPAVIVTHGWLGRPADFGGLIDDLARDHRVITFDPRGTGDSTRSGPYDIETDTADLEALLEEVGASALWLVGDAASRGIRVLARRPELIPVAVCYGAPLSRSAIADSEAMAASDEVVSAFQEMLRRDYRGALRSAVRSGNEQMSEDEVRERVASQVEYYPQEAVVARVHAWVADEPLEHARAAGARVWIVIAEGADSPWFPPGHEMLRIVREQLPQARVVELEDGALSRPDLNAEVVRRAVRETAEAAAERR
jgi:pimeloyl-ACP methyl ester carboxylesterase